MNNYRRVRKFDSRRGPQSSRRLPSFRRLSAAILACDCARLFNARSANIQSGIDHPAFRNDFRRNWPATSSPVSVDRSETGQWPHPTDVAPSPVPGYTSPPKYPDQPTQPNLTQPVPTQPAPAYSQFPDSSIDGAPATWPAHMPPAGPAPQQTAPQTAMSAAAPWPAPTSQSPAGYATGRSPTAAIPNAISRYQAAQQQQQGAYNLALEQMGRPLGVGSAETAIPATNHGGTNAADGRPVHVYPPGM